MKQLLTAIIATWNANNAGALAGATALFSTPGGATWTAPVGLTADLVECIAGAGGGAAGSGGVGGGAGGGGAYSAKSPTLVAGTTYSLTVGAAGAGGVDGGDSSFDTSVLAKGGRSAVATGGAPGGDAAAGTGTTKYSGGLGASNNGSTGGGGGGNASASGNGVDHGSPPVPGTGGGAGGLTGVAGTDGTAGGGGGGGDGAAGAAGSAGSVCITYSTTAGTLYGIGGPHWDEAPEKKAFPYCIISQLPARKIVWGFGGGIYAEYVTLQFKVYACDGASGGLLLAAGYADAIAALFDNNRPALSSEIVKMARRVGEPVMKKEQIYNSDGNAVYSGTVTYEYAVQRTL